jgi:poly-gamma-glutamate synthesis protein (capsule biosynthesis protein)
MRSLYQLHFPIRQIDAYGADDRRSIAADNTSVFNCRTVAGSGGVWSEYAYGRALDLNPLENPCGNRPWPRDYQHFFATGR